MVHAALRVLREEAGVVRVPPELADLLPRAAAGLRADVAAHHPAPACQVHAADVGHLGLNVRPPDSDDLPPGVDAEGDRETAQEPPNFPKDLADSVGVAVPGRKRDRLRCR